MSYRDSDIAFMLKDTGVPVVYGTYSGLGLLNENDEGLAPDGRGGMVSVPISTLTVRTSDFPTLQIDGAITVNGIAYTVRNRLKTGDSALTKISLSSGTNPTPPGVTVPSWTSYVDAGDASTLSLAKAYSDTAQALDEKLANKNNANGYCGLDGSGLVPSSRIVFPVTSVAGRTGVIVLSESDITNLTTDLAGMVKLAPSGDQTITGTHGLIFNFSGLTGVGGINQEAITVTLPEAAASTWDFSFGGGGLQPATQKYDWVAQWGYNVVNNNSKKATESAIYWGFESHWEQNQGVASSAQTETYLTMITPNASGGGPAGGPISTRVIFIVQNKLTGFSNILLTASAISLNTIGGSNLALNSAGDVSMTGNLLVTGGSVSIGSSDATLNRIGGSTLGVGSAIGGANHIATFLAGAIGIRSDDTIPSAFTFGSRTTGSKSTIEMDSAIFLSLENFTPATSGVMGKSSPFLYFTGRYWDGSASQSSDFSLQNLVASDGSSHLTLSFTGGGAAVGLPSFDPPRIGAVAGLAASPSYSFALERNLGMYRVGTQKLGFAAGNLLLIQMDFNFGLSLLQGSGLGFSGGAGAVDSGLTRLGASSLAIGNGTNGDFSGSLKLGGVSLVNATPATNILAQSSPILTLSGQYWTGSASAQDKWTIQSVIQPASGYVNLNFTHTGINAIGASVTMPELEICGVNGPTSGNLIDMLGNSNNGGAVKISTNYWTTDGPLEISTYTTRSSPNLKVLTDGTVNVRTPASAPTDANLNAANISFYLDEAGNNLKVRVKYSNGTTLKTATIALV